MEFSCCGNWCCLFRHVFREWSEKMTKQPWMSRGVEEGFGRFCFFGWNRFSWSPIAVKSAFSAEYIIYSVEWRIGKLCCFFLKNSRLWLFLPIEIDTKKEWTPCDVHSCDPGGIQTHNPHIRSVVLYSVEPRDQGVFVSQTRCKSTSFSNTDQTFCHFFLIKNLCFKIVLISDNFATFAVGFY